MLFATYGVSDSFDLGLAVPFVHVDLDARVDGRIFRTASGANSPTHSFDTAGADRATFTESGSSNGLGDMSIRAKYNFLRGDVTSFAAGLDLRLPTGDKDELLGTGATRAEMMFIYSGDYGRVSPHVNIGYTLSSGESSSAASQLDVDEDDHRLDTIVGLQLAAVDLEVPDEFNYVFGLNVAAHSRVTLGFDVRGRTLFDVSRFELRDNVYPNRGAGPLPTAGVHRHAGVLADRGDGLVEHGARHRRRQDQRGQDAAAERQRAVPDDRRRPQAEADAGARPRLRVLNNATCGLWRGRRHRPATPPKSRCSVR